jgi:FAD/FMN-containing dehydrogenase
VAPPGELTRGRFLRLAGAGVVVAGAGLGAAPLAGRTGRPPLGDLARATQGALITPGSSSYAGARRMANARYSGARPLAVLRARSVSDVRQAVVWCARNGVRITARSGGHSYAGYSTLSGGLVVDLGALDGLRVAADRRTVQVGAGSRLIDVYSALARRGLTVPAGSCPTVGLGGLALGGGVGLASRALGTTCDNVVALTLVTADGRALECDARRNSDLFWACRGGGGGNFGIATGFTLRTHRVDSASHFFASFPWSRAAAVVAAWQRWAPHAPDELYSICSLSTGGGTPSVTVFGQYMGGAAPLRRALAGLTSAVPPGSLSVGTSSYLDLMLRWAGCLGDSPAECRRLPSDLFAAKSSYARAPIAPGGIAALVGAIERRQRQSALGSGAILLDSYGGAINRVAPDATAFVHRDALFSLQYLAYWGREAGAAPARAWIRAAHAAARPFVSGSAYQNYIDPDLADWQRAYYGGNLPRLIDVKAAADPDDLFRFRQSIPTH